jgi:hypothetical protein
VAFRLDDAGRPGGEKRRRGGDKLKDCKRLARNPRSLGDGVVDGAILFLSGSPRAFLLSGNMQKAWQITTFKHTSSKGCQQACRAPVSIQTIFAISVII